MAYFTVSLLGAVVICAQFSSAAGAAKSVKAELAVSLTFVDEDPVEGVVAGEVSVRSKEAVALHWADASGDSLGAVPGGELPPGGGRYAFPLGARPPVGAALLVAVALGGATAGAAPRAVARAGLDLGPPSVKVTTSSFENFRGVYDLANGETHDLRPVYRQRRGEGVLYHACGRWRVNAEFPTCVPGDGWADCESQSFTPLWPMHRDGWRVNFKYENDYTVWRPDPWFEITKYATCLGI